ncbi:MAG: hypothetical protein DME17_06555 [Candidatus Rokuibacteriota bacterium]|nr:MAG: hypothetical protein DME17_06555 [Candidatus Rokubacteria bacterium]
MNWTLKALLRPWLRPWRSATRGRFTELGALPGGAGWLGGSGGWAHVQRPLANMYSHRPQEARGRAIGDIEAVLELIL